MNIIPGKLYEVGWSAPATTTLGAVHVRNSQTNQDAWIDYGTPVLVIGVLEQAWMGNIWSPEGTKEVLVQILYQNSVYQIWSYLLIKQVE